MQSYGRVVLVGGTTYVPRLCPILHGVFGLSLRIFIVLEVVMFVAVVLEVAVAFVVEVVVAFVVNSNRLLQGGVGLWA